MTYRVGTGTTISLLPHAVQQAFQHDLQVGHLAFQSFHALFQARHGAPPRRAWPPAGSRSPGRAAHRHCIGPADRAGSPAGRRTHPAAQPQLRAPAHPHGPDNRPPAADGQAGRAAVRQDR